MTLDRWALLWLDGSLIESSLVLCYNSRLQISRSFFTFSSLSTVFCERDLTGEQPKEEVLQQLQALCMN
jgi:hypothetical protein